MILEAVRALGDWTWWIIGLILLAAEIVIPGSVFVWFGIAAILTGAIALLADLGWRSELVIFAGLSVVLAVGGRRFFAARLGASDEPFLNRRADRLVGRTYLLDEPIVGGRGRIRVDDANWRVTGPDLPSGTRVRVVGHDGALLTVARAPEDA